VQQPQSSSSGMAKWIGLGVAILVIAGGVVAWQKSQKSATEPATQTQSVPASQPPVTPALTGDTQTKAAAVSSPARSASAPSEPVSGEPALSSRGKRIAKALQRAEARNETKNAAPPEPAPAPVQGGGGVWSQSDIPNLLSKADSYAGRGEYQRAIFLYEQILRIDPQNAGARSGLQRARDARSLRR
jgi:hypothetical protein